MRFIIRSSKESDISHLYRLAQEASLLNLPPDKALLEKKIQKSMGSFAAKEPPDDAQYVFVLEEVKTGEVTGTSHISAHYISTESPYYCFQVLEPIHSSDNQGVNVDQQILRLGTYDESVSALAGLVVDRRYRGLPEKRGKQISLIRMVFMGMFPERFEKKILSELMAPKTEKGINPFWETLGKSFTGLSYEEAFQLARKKDRAFIGNYFPKEDICISRQNLEIYRGRDKVLESGRPQQHMLETIGFQYLNKVDPMDGGLLYGANLEDITIVKKGAFFQVGIAEREVCKQSALVGIVKDGCFRGGQFPVNLLSETAFFPARVLTLLDLQKGENIYLSPMG